MRRKRLRTGVEIGAWIGGLGLLLAAANLRNPYWLPVRDGAVPVVLALAVVGLAALWIWPPRRRGAARWVLVAVWLAAPVWAIADDLQFQRDKHAVLAARDEAARTLGKRFVVGYTTVDEIALLADRGLIAGVYLGPRATAERSVERLRDEIEILQRRRTRAGLPPLIVTGDPNGAVPHAPTLAALVGDASPRRITDDLTLAPVDDDGLCESVVDALRTVDLVLLGYDADQYYPAMRCARAALRAGRLTIARPAVARHDG